jgi:anti-sigma regulatory factor (Ser/Thr protein kinase)
MDYRTPLLHRTFGVFSKNQDLFTAIQTHLDGLGREAFTSVFCDQVATALEFVLYELPDFLVVDLDHPLDSIEEIATVLREDPWLLGIGVIGFSSKDSGRDFLHLAGQWNLMALVGSENSDDLVRILKSVLKTSSPVMDYSTNSPFESRLMGRIEIENDIEEAERTANLASSYLLDTGRIDRKKYFNLNIGLSELLINAIEHGNCKISFSEKTALLEKGTDLVKHIQHLNQSPEIQDKAVTLDYEIQDEKSIWTITDMGNGFEFAPFLQPQDKNLYLPHGRGILMALNSSDELRYNEKGNQVTLVCKHLKEDEYRIPSGFRGEPELEIEEEDVVFEEGETSSYLYYILSGEFRVTLKGRTIGFLSPSDMFLGEMSFLLNRRRSATVTATRSSRLLKIPHKSFIRIIKKHPNYMLLMSRLLAQRLSRSNQKTPTLII